MVGVTPSNASASSVRRCLDASNADDLSAGHMEAKIGAPPAPCSRWPPRRPPVLVVARRWVTPCSLSTTSLTARPTASSARSTRSRWALPRRQPAMPDHGGSRPQSPGTSRSLWVMNTIARPRLGANASPLSAGLLPAAEHCGWFVEDQVPGIVCRAFKISTASCTPTGKSSTRASGSMSSP